MSESEKETVEEYLRRGGTITQVKPGVYAQPEKALGTSTPDEVRDNWRRHSFSRNTEKLKFWEDA